MLTLVLFALTFSSIQCMDNFKGHRILTIFTNDTKELDAFRRLTQNPKYDVWKEPSTYSGIAYVRVSPNAGLRLEKELKNLGLLYRVSVKDLQQLIEEEQQANTFSTYSNGRTFNLGVYHSLEEILAYLEATAKKNKAIASVVNIGYTYEKNPIKGLKIGSKGSNKPVVWIDCGVHAREWVSPATCLFFIDKLVKGYDSDPEIKQMVDYFDWYIFPSVNPDGYKYTWTTNRMWRKNRAESSLNSTCVGTDINRNFGTGFGEQNESKDPCDDIYAGREAFSELETQAIRGEILKRGKKIKAFFSFHAFSQLWMAPYAVNSTKTRDHEDHMKILEAATKAVYAIHGIEYKYGPIATTIYPASGSSIDWAYEVVGIKYAFAVEMRDKGEKGFMLAQNEILPNAEENFAGVKTVMSMIKKEI